MENNLILSISNISNSFLEGLIFTYILFTIHLIFSYHPHHRLIPLLLSTLLFLLLVITLNYQFINSDVKILDIILDSVTNSLSSILNLIPIIFLMSTFMILKLTFRSRPKDPLLDLLESNLNFD